MKKIIPIVIVALLVLFFYFWQQNQNQFVDEQQPQSGQWLAIVSFEFAPDDIARFNYQGEGEKSLFAITQDITSEQKWGLDFQDYGEMGWIITQIGTQANGTDNKYWQYFVNDEQPMLAVNKFYPQNGDKIEWKFIESEF